MQTIATDGDRLAQFSRFEHSVIRCIDSTADQGSEMLPENRSTGEKAP